MQLKSICVVGEIRGQIGDVVCRRTKTEFSLKNKIAFIISTCSWRLLQPSKALELLKPARAVA